MIHKWSWALFLFLKQVQRLQTTTMPTWSTVIVQTSRWPTQEKYFHTRWLVSHLLINNSYNVVAMELQLVISFSCISSKTATTIPMPTVYGDCKPVFLYEFSCEDGYLRKVSCSGKARNDTARNDTAHSDVSMHVSVTWKFVRFQCPCRLHCYACIVRACL